MIKIDFSEEKIETLKHERFYHPHPRVQRKMEALLLKSQKIPHEQICQIADISANTLRFYLQAYIAGGIENLAPFRRTFLVFHIFHCFLVTTWTP